MATHTGSEGIVKISANTVAETKSWTLEETAATIPDSAMGDTHETFKTGLRGWSGSIDCFYDPSDADGQEALAIGDVVVVNLYPTGDGSGDQEFSGNAIVTGISRQAAHDGMIDAAFSYQGSGVLTKGAVA